MNDNHNYINEAYVSHRIKCFDDDSCTPQKSVVINLTHYV